MSTPDNEKEKDDTVPFFPNHFMTEFYVALGFIALAIIIGAIGMRHPVGLEAPADPLNTPLHVKPEWYFLFLYQMLKLVPAYLFWGQVEGRVFITFMVIVALIAWMCLPFLDRKEDTSRRNMVIRGALSAIALIIIIALTIWGEVS